MFAAWETRGISQQDKYKKQGNAWTQTTAAAETLCSACKPQIGQVSPQQKLWVFSSTFLSPFSSFFTSHCGQGTEKRQQQEKPEDRNHRSAMFRVFASLRTQEQEKKPTAAQKASFKMFQAKPGKTLFYPPTQLLLIAIQTPNTTDTRILPGNGVYKEQEN